MLRKTLCAPSSLRYKKEDDAKEDTVLARLRWIEQNES